MKRKNLKLILGNNQIEETTMKSKIELPPESTPDATIKVTRSQALPADIRKKCDQITEQVADDYYQKSAGRPEISRDDFEGNEELTALLWEWLFERYDFEEKFDESVQEAYDELDESERKVWKREQALRE